MAGATLRRIPIHRVGLRHHLFLGGDREMVMMSGLLSAALAFTAVELRATAISATLWGISLYLFRKMAAADPMMRQVYLRHRQYRPYYPARSRPWRSNGPIQGRRYR